MNAKEQAVLCMDGGRQVIKNKEIKIKEEITVEDFIKKFYWENVFLTLTNPGTWVETWCHTSHWAYRYNKTGNCIEISEAW